MVGAGKGAGKVAGEFHKRYKFQLPNGIKNGSRLNSGPPVPKIVRRDKAPESIVPNRISKVGQSHPSLPVRKNPGDPTHGIFNDKKPLMSGADGGNALEVFRSRIGSLSKDAVTSLKHVEGHAAAEMVSNNFTEAVLHVNYKTGPCQYCRRGISELLGEGQKLWVVFPDGIGYFTNKGWFPQ